MKTWSEDVENVKTGSANVAWSYYHSKITTCHLFLSLMKFLTKECNLSDEKNKRYANTINTVFSILEKYNIKGKDFKKEFEIIHPRSLPPSSSEKPQLVLEPEFQTVFGNLQRKAQTEKRQMEIENLIVEIFSDRSYEFYIVLENIIKSVNAENENKIDDVSSKIDNLRLEILDAFKSVTVNTAQYKDLDKIPELTNLNKWVKEHKQVAIGMENDVNSLEVCLNTRTINSAILVGPAGVGKTMAVYELCNRINSGDVSERLKNKRIYELDATAAVAGTKFRGDFEQKLLNILEAAKKAKVILFIDEIHQLVKLGGVGDGDSGGAGDIIKPYITRGDIQIIGATTNDEYAKNIECEKAFARRFHKVLMNEPSKAETIKILKGIKELNETFFKKKISDQMIEEVVNLSSQYSIDQANPAKSISMLELAAADSVVFNEKGEAVMTKELIDAIRLKYGIFISENKTETTMNALNSYILGQKGPLKKIEEHLSAIECGLNDPDKPLLSMIFAGPTGTGKTETAKIIARNFCGKDENLIKINMGEYGSEMDVSKLVGSAPGYVGSDEEAGLVSLVKQHPNSVVLFDEVEKANPKVFDVLLNILDTGTMVDNHKVQVSFKNCIIIFTTNLGYDKDFTKAKGIGFEKHTTTSDDILEKVQSYFRPEFINRLDDIIVFNGLNDEIATTLINRYLKEYQELSDNKFVNEIKFTKSETEEIISRADIKTFGARSLKRSVKQEIIKKISQGQTKKVNAKKELAKSK